MSLLPLSFTLLIPALPFLAGLAVRRRNATLAGRIASISAWTSFALALTSVVSLVWHGPATMRWSPLGPDAALALALKLDTVSIVMTTLVAFLGAVVLGFSERYLEGDEGRARFLSWMSFTLGSVLILVLSGHLLLLLAAWISSSLCLHQLLLFYPNRPGARFSARKKFVFSRVGDACLLSAALVLHSHFGTYDIESLLNAVAAGKTEGVSTAAALLAACAMLKSAQFPFHSWLPDTMETPTPVSAFMHAGIVNAGGFLVVRFAPLFAAAPVASAALAVVGAFTAAFGAVVMLAQPSVKRSLAYSTIAQMGFMLLQCGLGAYGLAFLHIAAHSLYKAHAFLTAGSTIGTLPRTAIPLRTPALSVGVLSGALLVALGAIALHVFLPDAELPSGVFLVVLALALAYGLARRWSAGINGRALTKSVAAALLIAFLSLNLHVGANALLSHLPRPTLPTPLLVFLGALFVGLFLFQALLWRVNQFPFGRRLYVHALNGFYVGTLFNRLLGRLWPQQSPMS